MGKAVGLGILVAAAAGALIGVANKWIGMPSWAVGGVAGMAGVLAVQAFARNKRGE